jgi:hypothetical protein
MADPKRASIKAKHHSKVDRRNTAKMIQANKRADTIKLNRLFTGTHPVPKMVGVVPLCPDVDLTVWMSCLFKDQQQDMPMDGPLYLRYLSLVILTFQD